MSRRLTRHSFINRGGYAAPYRFPYPARTVAEVDRGGAMAEPAPIERRGDSGGLPEERKLSAVEQGERNSTAGGSAALIAPPTRPAPAPRVKLDLRNAPSSMEMLAASWRGRR